MFKKILTGFIVAALALTSMPIDSSADVAVGDNLNLFGDFRFRAELNDVDTTGVDKRERQRLRLRIGGNYQTAVESLSFGFRLATGSGNSLNSPHDTFDTGTVADNSAFGLDRAYMLWKFLESGVLIIGKQGYPLWNQTEVMWDTDIQPEGFAAAYTASLGDAGSLTAAAAYYYVVENGLQDGWFDNDTLTAWQVAHQGAFNDVKTVVAVTGMHGTDGDNGTSFRPTGSTNTEATPEPAFYQVSGQVKFAFDQYKLLLGGDYNFSDWNETGDDHDAGYVIQGRVNTGPYGVRYYYYDIEEASVPFYGDASLSQDNFQNINSGGGLTGFEGHRIQLDYKIASGVAADFRIYIVEGKSNNRFTNLAETASLKSNRYQFNLNMKF